jgi:hypothetical protein
MKNILLLLAIVGGGYYYYANHMQVGVISVHSYKALLKKAETAEVTRAEVIFGVNDLANSLCTDSEFQTSGGYSVAECQKRYANYKEMCESRLFESAPETYSRPEEVKVVAKAYAGCVGIK